MITRSIQNIDLFKIKDDITQSTGYGFDQAWYKTRWQRTSGCGPTVASNLIYYLNCTYAGFKPDNAHAQSTKSICLKLMEEVWEYVTPKLQGVNTTKMLYHGVLAYAEANGMHLKHDFLDIPRKRRLRPEFDSLLSFINDALAHDQPVAFLNLNNGAERLLYSWHWVTIIALEYSEDGSAAVATIMDEGLIKRINLAQWFTATTLGGGFVSFKRIE